jgi:hypothetical protein
MIIAPIKLIQIKDIYAGQVDLLLPLIERIRVHGYPLEILPVKRCPEWTIEYQCYEPLPGFAYLVAAAKLALPDPETQIAYALQTYLVEDEFDDWSKEETETLLESSRIRLLLKRGKVAIDAYLKKVRELKSQRDKLKEFAQLVNEAEAE